MFSGATPSWLNQRHQDVYLQTLAKKSHTILRQASEDGDIDLVKFSIAKDNPCDYFLNAAIRFAAKGGHKHIVDFFIEKNWSERRSIPTLMNSGLGGAANGGHLNLVLFFIEKGAKTWDLGMFQAAYGGHKHLVDFFIEKGATDWNHGMAYSAQAGRKDFVDFFIKKGANKWGLAKRFAADRGFKDLVNFFEIKMIGQGQT